MPTRTDAQGLMMCEMASIGIPLITSDIPVCHESLGNFNNVAMINNENYNLNLEEILNSLEKIFHILKSKNILIKNKRCGNDIVK